MKTGRNLARSLGLTALLVLSAPAAAQEGMPDPVASPILMIDQERLFVESAFGRAVFAQETATASALAAENAGIEARLVAEEQDLTEQRARLTPAEFTTLAEAFDAKVVRIRAEQDAKARDLTRTRDGDRQEFFRAVVPVLGELLVERKAVAVIDKSAMILALSAIDVTDAAIAKVDAALGSGGRGSAAESELEPDPAPDLSPGPALGPAPAPVPSSP